MITYVYVVKCPDCEDEFFDFFDEAKDFAQGCLTKKPVITQTEVNRNDFGECVDHCDLGTVWSWEDMMKEPEPEDMVFSKNETFGISEGLGDFDDFDIGPQIDEFETFDNSLDFDFEEDEIPEDPTEPIEEDFDRVKAAAKCSRNCYDFYKAIASKAPQKEINKYGKAAYKYVKDQYGLVDDAAEDLLWSGYVVWKKLNENAQAEPVEEAMSDFQRKLIDRLTPMTKDEFQKRLQSEETVTIFTGDPREIGIRSRDYEASYEDGKYEVSFWDETYDDDFTDSEVAETFDNIDDLWAFMVEFMEDDDFYPEYNYLAEGCAKKPIPKGMTIEQLQEEMEANEDTVECSKCGNLVEKANCHHNQEGFGWCCNICEPADTLVEAQEEYELAVIVKDSINHLTNDIGKDPWAKDFADDVIADIENNYDVEVPEDLAKYNSWANSIASEVSRQVNNPIDEEVAPKEVHDLGNTYDGGYPEDEFNLDFPEV